MPRTMSEGTVTVRMGEVVEPHALTNPDEGVWTRTLVHYDAEECPSVVFVDVESHNLDTGKSNPVISVRFTVEEIAFISRMVAAGMKSWGSETYR
jgi:hypothetical protein